MTYFSTVKTLSDLKSEYHRLTLANHPDVGGDASEMRNIIEMYKEIKEEMRIGSFVPYVPTVKVSKVKKVVVDYDYGEDFDLDSFMSEDIYDDSIL